jgi:hypothetical protein
MCSPDWERARVAGLFSLPAVSTREMSRPRVEILSFDGCPNYEAARTLVERLAGELGIEPHIELIEVVDPDAAVGLRFLGSPTVRVDGVDVEPGAGERGDYALACRIYPGEPGVSELPHEQWVRDALMAAASQ